MIYAVILDGGLGAGSASMGLFLIDKLPEISTFLTVYVATVH